MKFRSGNKMKQGHCGKGNVRTGKESKLGQAGGKKWEKYRNEQVKK